MNKRCTTLAWILAAAVAGGLLWRMPGGRSPDSGLAAAGASRPVADGGPQDGDTEPVTATAETGTGHPHSAVTKSRQTEINGTEAGITDRYADADVLASAVSKPDGNMRFQRERLIRCPGKYPLRRVEEEWLRTPSGRDILLQQTVMVGDHVILQLHEGQDAGALQKSLARHGFTLREAIGVPRGYLVAVAPATLDSVPAMVAAMAAEPFVALVEPDYVYYINETRPDDTHYGLQWGMETIGMPRVWSATTGTGGVVVAVFDTGIDLTHPDLSPNLWINPGEVDGNGHDDDGNGYVDDIYGWDFYHHNNNPSDAEGHGTHVAGIIGATGGNRIGVAGTAWNVHIMPIKFFGTNSAGQLEGYAHGAASGMYYVIAQASRGVPVRVTNHSWGGSGESAMLREAFEIAANSGIMHVAAAGNGYGTSRDNDLYPHYPASFNVDSVVAVANTTSNDTLNGNSYYGATSVDLGAPGTTIWSTLRGGGYGVKSGTSMASPYVAGVAALLFDMFPDLTWREVRDLLFAGTDPLPGLSGLCVTGGRLNANNTFARIPPQISHTPLQNATTAVDEFLVEAVIRPGPPFTDADRTVLRWNTTGSTNVFETLSMPRTAGDHYQALLTGQPAGNSVYYLIQAENTAGRVSTHPAGAPGTLHRFDITYPVALHVYGAPGYHGDVTPGYGTGYAPWGSIVEAAAPAFTPPVDDRRWRCTGWDGAGSVPFAGTTHRFNFEIRGTSYLVWKWKAQALLTQTSQPAGAVHAAIWFDTDAAGTTVPAPSTVMLGGVEYRFTAWIIDGQRYPDTTSPAVNPAAPLAMQAPRTAVARYLPATQDLDGDRLPDWWEMFYFNHLDYNGHDDVDNNGFSNAQEYADRSDPTDPESAPEGPAITHTPLPAYVQTRAPWRIEAAITDRVDVAVAVLRWKRNQGAWADVRMQPAVTGTLYTAYLPAPDTPEDVFAYQITAEDSGRNASTTAVHHFTVRYPVLIYGPAAGAVTLFEKSSAIFQVALTNTGNAELAWAVINAWTDTIGAEAGAWTHGGARNQWHISTRETHSPPYAWFCGDQDGRNYNHSMDASLYTPPVLLGTAPVLRFQHWPEMEYDGRQGYEQYYWDGAVVEITRNGGLTFESITPVNGYPYRITPNPDSPFEGHRPCFGGISGGWREAVFDLADYAGETVQVRFRFGTDRYVESRGWFIDDVAFTWGADWIQADPPSGTVAPGSAGTIELRLDASTLQAGRHQGTWVVECNAPGKTRFGGTISLQVKVMPPETSIQLDSTAPQNFVMTWHSETGRIYSLYTGTGLMHGARWQAVPGFTNMPGVTGSMSYTGIIDSVRAKFYRIEEKRP